MVAVFSSQEDDKVLLKMMSSTLGSDYLFLDCLSCGAPSDLVLIDPGERDIIIVGNVLLIKLFLSQDDPFTSNLHYKFRLCVFARSLLASSVWAIRKVVRLGTRMILKRSRYENSKWLLLYKRSFVFYYMYWYGFYRLSPDKTSLQVGATEAEA